tara:strand:+ start:1243 stop:2088 length:846 start_codon:yes stop_codon:yes gene_type:complete
MKLFKLFISIFFLSNLLAQDQDELEEYKIELIIFENININTTETFNSILTLPKENVLSFYEPELLINTTELFPKNNGSFFTKMLKNLRPSFTKNNTNEEVKKIIPNPGYWFRKNDNLEKLKKLNSKLLSNNNYKVLNSYSWIQNIENKEISKYLFEQNAENKYGYYLKFYKSRFLHVDLKAYIGIAKPVDNKIITDSHIKSYENEILSRKTEQNTDEKLILDLNLKNEFTQVTTLPIEEPNKNQLYNDINIFIDEQKRIFDGEVHFFDHPYFGIVISIEKI